MRHYAGTLSKTHAKAGQRNDEIKTILPTIQNDLLHEFIVKKLYHFASDFDRLLLQLLGTDIENCLLKYRVSYRHLTVMIETFELLKKSCEKFIFLLVNIQCATECSLEK